ncbi:MAG: 4-alpha-glucanotransferase [Omnitrophica WOR_2 bacterium RIFCSPHIGHO2_02_FULL_52_10]|nr:MAG: 4-alpha-glucanotransferase [Omnitrophica WOR_2 bacterium RIFCSPHIGHO2_02_FULL_52_10]
MSERASGILLHISSLPSPFGIGDLGESAYRFADFLHDAKQIYWQILPINPTDPISQHSPYSSTSAFAGNELLISPQLLVKERLLNSTDITGGPEFPVEHVDFEAVKPHKDSLLERAATKFEARPTLYRALKRDFNNFLETHRFWMEDYALFSVIKKHHGGAIWTSWPKGLRDRNKNALLEFSANHAQAVHKIKFYQFLFFRQWQLLRRYCRKTKIKLIGDLPIYMNLDSADVWANPKNYKLETDGAPSVVSGVPPDYFSRTGQLWGNPVYDWKALKKANYSWWVQRFRFNFQLFDLVRVDHFRGFVKFWEIPAGHTTAVDGQWASVPTHDFFKSLERACVKPLPIIAEDLGFITDDVRDVIRGFNFPGMKVLMFAFNGDDVSQHPYLPENYTGRCVVYTGTHDNNTVRGWFQQEVAEKVRGNLNKYFGRDISAETVHWELIRLALGSPAELAIIPLQDYLGLGSEARMNTPATVNGNWRWRVDQEKLTKTLMIKIAEETMRSERN